MVEARIIPRAEHPISRRAIDADALKVLYRLHQLDYLAYLVGGSVRDLLLGRQPKDFDVSTSAHPYEVKRAFRNCWIVGRRFRLAHVKFGTKTIEVATFRRMVKEDEPSEPAAEGSETTDLSAQKDRLIRRDNTFGTAEEDAFRRDFTINALFYDIATFSIIDYVGGIDDLRARRIRSIGNPEERFEEDPVRMLRAIVLAARLDFEIDRPVYRAIEKLGPLIARASQARLLEEIYKILRSGHAERAFHALADVGLLEHISPELSAGMGNRLTSSLARLDAYRHRFDVAPETLRNAVLLGTLLAPIGAGSRPRARTANRRRQPLPTLGALPLARRDVERLGQIVALERRLNALDAPARGQHALTHRSAFADALTWLEIHGQAPEVLTHWRLQLTTNRPPAEERDEISPWRRRRRRRRPRRTGET